MKKIKRNINLSEKELNSLIERKQEISIHSMDERTGEEEIGLIVSVINNLIDGERAVTDSLRELITIKKEEAEEPLIDLIKLAKHVLFINNDNVDKKKFTKPKLVGRVLIIPGPLPNELRHKPL